MSRKFLIVWLLLVTFVLAACGGPNAASEPDVVDTPEEVVDGPTNEETAVPEPEEIGGELPEAPVEEEAVNRTFTIVAEESEASYSVEEEFFQGAVDRLGEALGLTDTVGSTREIVGEIQLTDSFDLVAGQFTVKIRSLTSNQSRRDEKIQEEWLQSNLFPEAVFVLTAVSGIPADYTEGHEVNFQMSGDMTIREITHPVTFDGSAFLDGNTLTGVAITMLRMTDYGFEPPAISNFFTVADEFTVKVQFTAREG